MTEFIKIRSGEDSLFILDVKHLHELEIPKWKKLCKIIYRESLQNALAQSVLCGILPKLIQQAEQEAREAGARYTVEYIDTSALPRGEKGPAKAKNDRLRKHAAEKNREAERLKKLHSIFQEVVLNG